MELSLAQFQLKIDW